MENVTTKQDIQQLFDQQKAFFPEVAQTSIKERLQKLKALRNWLTAPEQVQAAKKALATDFNKPSLEVVVSEVIVILSHLNNTIKNLSSWSRPKRVGTPLNLIGTRSYIHYEPKGVCLIFSPWNYPINLSLLPLISAIAAGNTAIIKPSERTPHTSSFIAKGISSLFDPKEVAVVEGGVDAAQELLKLPFNHIFFTGSPHVGKIIMKAAAEHLASVTLELGGKSPAIIDGTVPLNKATEKITWAKCFNGGQTCIAPDYLLIEESLLSDFVENFKKSLLSFYGNLDTDLSTAPKDLCTIVDKKHFTHLTGLIEEAVEKGAQVAVGGQSNSKNNFLAPTLLTGIQPEMRIMKEEIFGPVLPVMTFTNFDECIAHINKLPRPLSTYIASNNKNRINALLKNTTAGGTVINDYLLGFGNPNLPFGGVNHSGIGKSFGKFGFEAFSNQRSIIKRKWGNVRPYFPPYKNASLETIPVKLGKWL